MKRKLFVLLCTVCLLLASFSITSNAATKEDIMISSCDVSGGWGGGFIGDRTEFTEGKGSVVDRFKIDPNGTSRVYTYGFTPIDATGYNTLKFDFYISDPTFFDYAIDTQLELTSSGTWDREEAGWSFKIMFEQGWNEVSLDIPPNTCNMSRVNFLRLYAVNIPHYTDEEIVLRFDNIRLSYTDPELLGPELPGIAVGKSNEKTENVKTAVPDLTPMTVPQTETYLRQEFLIISIAAFVIGVAALVAFIILLVNKKIKTKTALRIVSICLAVVAIGGGVASYLLYLQPQQRTVDVPIPQMDMEQVEAALKVDKQFDTKEAYKQIYKSKSADSTEKCPDEWNFKTPTVVQPKYNPEQYVVAVTTVRAFGAKGNGTHNDTSAFMSAISYVSTRGGGVVFVPEGRYCLTAGLNLPSGVILMGELEPGTINGTVLQIYGSKGKPNGIPAISMSVHSGVKNIAFWYPEQEFVNGQPIPYPPTIRQNGHEGFTVENINLVNSYYGIDMATNSQGNALQCVRDVYGTPLSIGMHNDNSLDIGRFENINFAPDYWLLSGLPNVPEQQLLTTWMLRNATAIRIGRVDWTYYTDINIKGYYTGIEYYVSSAGANNGHLYNANITECYYPTSINTHNWINITNSKLSAIGNDGAAAVYIPMASKAQVHLQQCEIASAGKNAVYNPSITIVTMVGCKVSSVDGTPFVTTKNGLHSTVNTTFSSSQDKYYSVNTEIPAIPEFDHNRVVITKPKSTKLIDLGAEPYKIKKNYDITETLQSALDELKTTGGIVYVPAGVYKITGPITVWEGIEITGPQDVPNYHSKTVFMTNYGENDPDATALITLKAGAGLRAINIKYNEMKKHGMNIPPYAYTIRGDGAGIYVVNVTLPFVYNGIDFATNRCDNHYVEYVWGCAGNIGIHVGGGSENGIIRDCMFTQNTSWTAVDDQGFIGTTRPMLLGQSSTFKIGKSKNQILYHTFVYAAYKGIDVGDGAENCVILSHGTDSGNFAAYFSGNCSVTLVDPQLCAYLADPGAVPISNNHRTFIKADETFTGTLTVHNASCWGTPSHSIILEGDGTYRFYQTYLHAAGNSGITIDAGTLEMALYARRGKVKYDVKASDKVKSITINGSLADSKLALVIPENVPVKGNNAPTK